MHKSLINHREGNVLYPKAFIHRIYKANWEQLKKYLDSKNPYLLQKTNSSLEVFPF